MNIPEKITNICCIGAVYVGGSIMAVIEEKCHEIRATVIDINKDHIAAWNSKDISKLLVYELELAEIIGKRRGKNLFFSTDVDGVVEAAEMIFMTVNTPTMTYEERKRLVADLKL